MSTYLNTHDLGKRLDELTDELDALEEALEEALTALRESEDESEEEDLKESVDDASDALAEWHTDNDEEHKALQDLAEEITLSNDETMIPDNDDNEFTAYVEELCTDCGYISKDFPSWIEIDWDKTAENVKQDYTEVDYMGETYQVRTC